MSKIALTAPLTVGGRLYAAPWTSTRLLVVFLRGAYDATSRSHFETQDSIELGQSLNGTRDFQSGFMSRLADQLTDVKPIAFTDQLPVTFRGGPSVPNMGLNTVTKPGVDDRQAALIKGMYRGTSLEPSVA